MNTLNICIVGVNHTCWRSDYSSSSFTHAIIIVNRHQCHRHRHHNTAHKCDNKILKTMCATVTYKYTTTYFIVQVRQLPVTRIQVISPEHMAWHRDEHWDFPNTTTPAQTCNYMAWHRDEHWDFPNTTTPAQACNYMVWREFTMHSKTYWS